MALNARKVKSVAKGPQQEAMEAGTYPARVVQVIDFGVQEQRAYKGVAKPPAQTVYLTYEFLDEFCKDEDGEDQDDKPRWLSEQFPLLSLEVDLATSTKRYKALDPEENFGGDFTLLVSAPCMVTINQYESKGQMRNGVSSVAPMRPKEAAKAPELVNPPKVLLIDNPDLEIFKSLPEWMQEKIKESLEFNGSALDDALHDKAPVKKVIAKPNRKAAPEAAVEVEEDGVEGEDDPW
jgi:hypothetical protein